MSFYFCIGLHHSYYNIKENKLIREWNKTFTTLNTDINFLQRNSICLLNETVKLCFRVTTTITKPSAAKTIKLIGKTKSIHKRWSRLTMTFYHNTHAITSSVAIQLRQCYLSPVYRKVQSVHLHWCGAVLCVDNGRWTWPNDQHQSKSPFIMFTSSATSCDSALVQKQCSNQI